MYSSEKHLRARSDSVLKTGLPLWLFGLSIVVSAAAFFLVARIMPTDTLGLAVAWAISVASFLTPLAVIVRHLSHADKRAQRRVATHQAVIAALECDSGQSLQHLLDTAHSLAQSKLAVIATVGRPGSPLNVCAWTPEPDREGAQALIRECEPLLRSACTEQRVSGVARQPDENLQSRSTVVVVPCVAGGKCGAVMAFFWESASLRARESGLLDILKSIGSVAATVLENDRALKSESAAVKRAQELTEQVGAEHCRLLMLLDRIPEGVIIASAPDGEITAINESALSILGGPATKARDIFRLTRIYHWQASPGADWNEEHPFVTALRDGETSEQNELTFERMDGRITTISVSASPVFSADGHITGAIAVFADISRIREEEHLKDNFLSATSHELRTPLTSIKGYAQLLLKQSKRDPSLASAVKGLQIINSEVDRISCIINNLLEVSRSEDNPAGLSLSRVDIVPLVQNVLESCQQETTRHSLILVRADSCAHVECDAPLIEKVLLSIVDNAVKYSPGGGRIQAELELTREDVVISVSDEGIGVPDSNQSRLFQRFFRAANARRRNLSGLGLGLYLSKRIVEQHGGHMWVRSQEGRGSTFYMSLPLARPHEQLEETPLYHIDLARNHGDAPQA